MRMVVPKKEFKKLLIVLYKELDKTMPNEDMPVLDFLRMANTRIYGYITHMRVSIGGVQK